MFFFFFLSFLFVYYLGIWRQKGAKRKVWVLLGGSGCLEHRLQIYDWLESLMYNADNDFSQKLILFFWKGSKLGFGVDLPVFTRQTLI